MSVKIRGSEQLLDATVPAAKLSATGVRDTTTFLRGDDTFAVPPGASITPAALTRVDDTNVTLTLGGTPATALLQATSITAGWSGTLAAARLNANVPQSVVNDTNVTGSIATQALTLGWAGTLAVARGGIGVGTLASNGVLVGQGTSAVAATAVGATNTVLHGNTAAPPTFSAVVEADLTLTDNVTNNTSTTKHGFCPKLSNVSTEFLNGTGAFSTPAGGSGAANKDVVNGRLTLETGVPVSTTNQAAKTTLYLTPYSGNQIGLYDGVSAWTVLTFAELSLSLAGFTASKLYDIWVYNNAGTAALDSTVWTSATVRATALAVQDGVLVKSGATTRRYVGTIYINSTGGQTDDTFSKANVWNFYNRVERVLKVTDPTASWTYSTNAWRLANNAAANQFEVTVGLAGDALEISATGMATSTSGNDKSFTGIGIDDSTNNSATTYGPVLVDTNTALPSRALYMDVTLIGYRTYRWLELPNAITGTMTWYGTNGAGMIGRVAR